MRKPSPESEIKETLELLRANSYNASVTAKQTGISRQTIMTWKEKYGAEVYKNNIDIGMVKTVNTIVTTKESIIQKTYEAQLALISRAVVLSNSETDLNKISNAIRELNTVYVDLIAEVGDNTKPQMRVSINEIITNMNIQQNNYEKKD